MSDVGQRTIQRLREFTEQLERNEPIKASVVKRYDTPDGPMHVHETVTLAAFCRECGEDFDECECP